MSVGKDKIVKPVTIRLALLIGSTREGRFADRIVDWAREGIGRHPAFDLDVIDPKGFSLPAHFPSGVHEGLGEMQRRLEQADAILIVTPEYNHSFPAVLKLVIDVTGEAWKAKPAAFISYGGVSGGLRAVEQLRLVLAELHTVTLRKVVSFMNAWELFDEQGGLLEPSRAERSLKQLLDQLSWWARVLRQGREQWPYRAVS